MDLLSIAHVPPVMVTPDETVMAAVEASLPARVGAVAVMEAGGIIGIFTERDVMLKVVHKRLAPETTLIRDVMSSPVTTIEPTMPPREVLEMMLTQHIRHLPISQDGKSVQGMLSIRNILQYLVDKMSQDISQMESFFGMENRAV